MGIQSEYAYPLPGTYMAPGLFVADAPALVVFDHESMVSRFFRLVVLRILFLVMGFR